MNSLIGSATARSTMKLEELAGLDQGLTNSEYHDQPGWSSSMLADFQEKGPAWAHGVYVTGEIPKPAPSAAMIRGSIVDEILLNGAKWEESGFWPDLRERVMSEALSGLKPDQRERQAAYWARDVGEASWRLVGPGGDTVLRVPPPISKATKAGKMAAEAWSLMVPESNPGNLSASELQDLKDESDSLVDLILCGDAEGRPPSAGIANELLTSDGGLSQFSGSFEWYGIPFRWRPDRIVNRPPEGWDWWPGSWATSWALVDLKVSRLKGKQLYWQIRDTWGPRMALYELGWGKLFSPDQFPWDTHFGLLLETPLIPTVEWLFVVTYHDPLPRVAVHRVSPVLQVECRKRCWKWINDLSVCRDSGNWWSEEEVDINQLSLLEE